MNLMTWKHIENAFVHNLTDVMENTFKKKNALNKISKEEKMALDYIAYRNAKFMENERDSISQLISFINESLLSGDTLFLKNDERNLLTEWIDVNVLINNVWEVKYYHSYEKNGFSPEEFAENLAKNLIYLTNVVVDCFQSESAHNYNKELLLINKLIETKDLERKNLSSLIDGAAKIIGSHMSDAKNEGLGIIEDLGSLYDKFCRNNKLKVSQKKYDEVLSILETIEEKYSDLDIEEDDVFRDPDTYHLTKVVVSEMLWSYKDSIENDSAFNENGMLCFLNNLNYVLEQEISPILKEKLFDILETCPLKYHEQVLWAMKKNDHLLFRIPYLNDVKKFVKILSSYKLDINEVTNDRIETLILEQQKISKIYEEYGDKKLDDSFFGISNIKEYRISQKDFGIFLRYKNELSSPFVITIDWFKDINEVLSPFGCSISKKNDHFCIHILEENLDKKELFFKILRSSSDIYNQCEESGDNYERVMNMHVKEIMLNRKLDENLNTEKKSNPKIKNSYRAKV